MAERKSLRCGTVFPGCSYVMHGESDAEILAKMADHAREVHDTEHISKDFRAKMQEMIRPDNPS